MSFSSVVCLLISDVTYDILSKPDAIKKNRGGQMSFLPLIKYEQFSLLSDSIDIHIQSDLGRYLLNIHHSSVQHFQTFNILSH